jgi:hypothetical protein
VHGNFISRLTGLIPEPDLDAKRIERETLPAVIEGVDVLRDSLEPLLNVAQFLLVDFPVRLLPTECSERLLGLDDVALEHFCLVPKHGRQFIILGVSQFRDDAIALALSIPAPLLRPRDEARIEFLAAPALDLGGHDLRPREDLLDPFPHGLI